MTPKKKAEDLVEKYYIICQEFTEEIQCSIQAKQCALIAVDELIYDTQDITDNSDFFMLCRYWEEVKQEIEKL